MKSEPPYQQHETFRHKKSLGQNFLTSAIVPSWMCDAAHLTSGETVLEVGPGTGMLTKELLARQAKVFAIETDARVIPELTNTFTPELETGQLTLIHNDIREVDLSTIGIAAGSYKLVANIPYYLSGFFLRFFLEHDRYPSDIVFLMQKELVERIARAEKESLLSLSVKVFGQPHYVKTVTRGHFHPQPKVDSAILSVSGISHSSFPELRDMENFFTVLRLGFGQKRKQLVGNLAKHYPRQQIEHILHQLHLKPDVRAEDMTLEQWVQFVHILSD